MTGRYDLDPEKITDVVIKIDGVDDLDMLKEDHPWYCECRMCGEPEIEVR